MNGEVINNVRYVDDTVGLAKTLEGLNILLNVVKAQCDQ